MILPFDEYFYTVATINIDIIYYSLEYELETKGKKRTKEDADKHSIIKGLLTVQHERFMC
jgi:hypothetical protein